MPGVLVVKGPPCQTSTDIKKDQSDLERFVRFFSADNSINRFTVIVIVDDAKFCVASLNNFLWTTFTRSNPAKDVSGIDEFVEDKHWGCRGSLVIDARVKPHHAPPLIEDPEVSKRVDALATRGGPLAQFL